jgi:hypothetical protein
VSRPTFAALALVVFAAPACGAGDVKESPVAVGRIICGETMLKNTTPRIRAQADGVHVDVRVRGRASFTIEGKAVSGKTVVQLSPGSHRIRCADGTGGSMGSWIEVVDADEGRTGY